MNVVISTSEARRNLIFHTIRFLVALWATRNDKFRIIFNKYDM